MISPEVYTIGGYQIQALFPRPSERKIANLVLMGYSPEEIARIQDLTLASVRTYLKRMYLTAGVKTRAELTARLLGLR